MSHLARLFLFALPSTVLAADPKLPTPQEMAAARTDVWGEAALKDPGGPSYEFFKDLLPPLRYVNTAFKHYPIVLSAPLAPVKARWVSNGSGINLKADKPPMWKEAGTPVAFFVGEKPEPFGADIDQLEGPRWSQGWLPVVQAGYKSGGVRFTQEAFAPVRQGLADHGAVFVRFGGMGAGRISARVGAGGKFTAIDGLVKDGKGSTVVQYGPGWKWDADKSELVAVAGNDKLPDLIVFTKPIPDPPKEFPPYESELKACVETWNKLVARGTSLNIPEPIVQDAWRALIVGQYQIAVGDRMHYSAGNAYDHLYEAECGDAVRSLLLFGQTADARKMVVPLLDFNRQATRFHVAGHKLQLLAHYYWMTRDKDTLKELRPKWEPVIAFIRESRRSTDFGLLPKDRYAGDINEQVYSLSSNAACLKGLRDMAAVLEDVGEKDKADELQMVADHFRRIIANAVTKSQDSKAKFIPMSLLANEKPHDPLTATRTGSYYDLMVPYVLGSGVFEFDDNREQWIIDYLRNHGGIAMGMIRSMPHQGEFNNEPGVNPLYGLRYNLALLRRGDRDHALVGFYGQLAQGMTRDTFVGGEGSRFLHGDTHGRSFYLPPNSASNACWLTTLRYLLIQDWDANDDNSKPYTLRLFDAIPSRWLKDGATIDVERAPSAFGPLTFRAESHLTKGEVVVTVDAPARPPSQWQLRLPDPPGYRITGVRVGDNEVGRDADGRVDLTGRTGRVVVRFEVAKK